MRDAGVKVCCGGIVGMGEAPYTAAGLLAQLANLQPYPESVPINSLVPVPGTPLADSDPVDPLDFVRVIAVARILMPRARVRLSAGRQATGRGSASAVFSGRCQLHFMAIKLLVTGNPRSRGRRAPAGQAGLAGPAQHTGGTIHRVPAAIALRDVSYEKKSCLRLPGVA